ncbi:methyltransferase domain-containing protein [Microbacterium sp. NPDC077184]|uniref:class I SAM-dependent methyltransferase n=1 Tax=Microbacterium sp. NPDC077184 TaxID=3154764 RepID=UPI00344310EB
MVVIRDRVINGVTESWDANAAIRAAELANNEDPSYRALINLALRHLGERVPAGGSVLDAGCGVGFLTRAMDDAGYDVTAVDPSSESIRQAKLHHPGIADRFQVATISNFASANPTRKFDAVVANMTVHNVDKFQTFFRAAHDLLARNGILYIATPNPRNYLQTRSDLRELVRDLDLAQPQTLHRVHFRIRNHEPHPAPITFYHHPIKEYLATARSVGLEIIDFEQPLHVGPGRPSDTSVMVFAPDADAVRGRG